MYVAARHNTSHMSKLLLFCMIPQQAEGQETTTCAAMLDVQH
jgi:hypothetical protein